MATPTFWHIARALGVPVTSLTAEQVRQWEKDNKYTLGITDSQLDKGLKSIPGWTGVGSSGEDDTGSETGGETGGDTGGTSGSAVPGGTVSDVQTAPLVPLAPTAPNSRWAEDMLGLRSGEGDTGTNLNSLFDRLTEQRASISEGMLRGELPQDVQTMVRQQAAENALQRGLGSGSQASRNLVARDLGLTSLDVIERGMTYSQATMEMAEAKREWMKSYDLDVQKLMEVMRQTNVDWAQLDETRRQFNASQVLKVNELMAQILGKGWELSLSYAINENKGQALPSGIAADIKGILNDLKTMI